MLDIDKIKSSIEGNCFISSVYYFKEIDSTNTYASDKNIPVDSLIITDHQLSGKGRLDRSWESAKDLNLTFSIKKRLTLSPAENHYLVCFVSFYVFRAVYKELEESLTKNELSKLFIKWPNDILFDNKKICGILVESKLPSNEYIIGIGINCNQKIFSSGIQATSIFNISGKQVDINNLLLKLVDSFSENFTELLSSEFEDIFKKWKKSTKIIGKVCTFDSGNGTITNGKIIDLNANGSISIQCGETVTDFYSGDIQITGFN